MSDIAEDWEPDGDWYDDEPSYVKEEPDCYACNDSGLIFDFDRETGRRCRSCQPSRIRSWWWRTKSRIYWLLKARRARQHLSDEEVPF